MEIGGTPHLLAPVYFLRILPVVLRYPLHPTTHNASWECIYDVNRYLRIQRGNRLRSAEPFQEIQIFRFVGKTGYGK